MTLPRLTPRRASAGAGAPRVGLFGLLGSGNLGNDGSLEAVLAYLRTHHPDAVVDSLCAGPEQVRARYGVAASPLHWFQRFEHRTSGASAIVLKVLGKAVDTVRTASWVRRHDVVIVPGMGVLEANLPLRPWGFPYSLVVLCASGRMFGTTVALVSVGADVVRQRITRWLFVTAARLAHYRSYRDTLSRDAMRRMGATVSGDPVYPDLVFALPTPPGATGPAKTVGVGVMAYHGGNDDNRRHAGEIHARYVEKITRFVRWLIDTGHRVRLFTGDTVDESVARELLADLRAYRPDLDASWVVAEPVSSLTELMREIASVDTVVATRYHNVLCALKLARPTLSIGYGTKNDALMEDMGLGEFCQDVRSFDVQRLMDQFTEVQRRRGRLASAMVTRGLTNVHRLEHQFSLLSATVLPARRTPKPTAPDSLPKAAR